MPKITLVIALLSIALILSGVRPASAQFYTQDNLVSDGTVPAAHLDPNMVNAWGLASSPTSPWWISNNGTGTTTLYRVNTGVTSFFTVPGATGPSAPTGMVRNPGTGFVVNNGLGSSAAAFILANEDGTISAFRGNPLVIAVNNSGCTTDCALTLTLSWTQVGTPGSSGTSAAKTRTQVFYYAL